MRSTTFLVVVAAALSAAFPADAESETHGSNLGKGPPAHAGGPHGGPPGQGRGAQAHRDSWFHRHGHARIHVPPGHLPPPGQCRVWHPRRPPGQQPPSGDCARLQREVPAGAWLLAMPASGRELVRVAVYDRPPAREWRAPLEVAEFHVDSGVIVRVLVDAPAFHAGERIVDHRRER